MVSIESQPINEVDLKELFMLIIEAEKYTEIKALEARDKDDEELAIKYEARQNDILEAENELIEIYKDVIGHDTLKAFLQGIMEDKHITETMEEGD